MHQLSQRSIDNLATVHPELQLIVQEAIKVSKVDFTITHGYRTPEEQLKLFKQGRKWNGSEWVKIGPVVTNLDGTYKKSKHNHYPSLAFDFKVFIPDKPELKYDDLHLIYVVGVIEATAELLRQQGVIQHKIRSGSNWDMDGELKYDQTFWDAPHIELVT